MENIKNLTSTAMRELLTPTPPLSPNTILSVEQFGWNFDTGGNPKLTEALEAAKRFVCGMQRMECPARWLALLGTAGTGKTHLARRIGSYFSINLWGRTVANESTEKRVVTMRGGFVRWTQASGDIRDGDGSVVDMLSNDWFVCLDDLFAEHQSDFLTAKLCEILDRRLGKWTVLTSNKTLSQIAEIEVRIASRMKRGGSDVVTMTGVPDYSVRRTQ